MNLSTVISPEDVILRPAGPTKSALIDWLAAHAAGRTGTDEAAIRAALAAREALGSTGVGGRVAVPHAAVAGLADPFAALVILKKAVAFDAVDDQPVDILFLLLTPLRDAGDHLKVLAAVARRTRDDRVLALLRAAPTAAAAHAVLVGDSPGGPRDP